MCTASRTGTMPYSDTTTIVIAVPLCFFDQLAGDGVDVTQILRQARIVRIGSPLLEAVVEMGQIAQRQGGLPRAANVLRCSRDPATGLDRGHRTPEGEQGEGPQHAIEFVPQLGRLSIVVRQLAAVGGIHGPRRGADVDGGIHIVPPEHVGAGEGRVELFARLPDFLPGDQAIRLPPQPYLGLLAKVPAIGHGAMVATATSRSAEWTARCR